MFGILVQTTAHPNHGYTPMQEMRLVFPNSHRINRGNYVVKELAEACRANDVSDLVILHEHRGVPGPSIHTVRQKIFISNSTFYQTP